MWNKEDLNEALAILKQGGVILYPTDTIWALGCMATHTEAVSRIYKIKQRVDSKAMLVLVGNTSQLSRHVEELPDIAFDLIEYSDRPLTIIYDGARGISPALLAEDGSIGIRVTQESFSKALCERLQAPIVSTSANVSGMPSPACFREIDPQLIVAVDYVVAYRQDDHTKATPSGIIKLGKGGLIKVIRE